MSKRHLLIVDDEPDMLYCVAAVLGAHFELSLVKSGLEALAALRGRDFDAVVLDLKMTSRDGVDGFDVLHYLSTCRPRTKVLIASGLPSLDRIAQRYGATDWLAKPYHLNALEERIARLVGDAPGQR